MLNLLFFISLDGDTSADVVVPDTLRFREDSVTVTVVVKNMRIRNHRESCFPN